MKNNFENPSSKASKGWTTIICVVVFFIAFFIIICFLSIVLLYFFILKPSPPKTEEKYFSYPYYEFNLRTNRRKGGIVRVPQKLKKDEYLSYPNKEKGSVFIISNSIWFPDPYEDLEGTVDGFKGMKEFDCLGSCVCGLDEEQKKIKNIHIVIPSPNVNHAIGSATDTFAYHCIEKMPDECNFMNSMGITDSCIDIPIQPNSLPKVDPTKPIILIDELKKDDDDEYKNEDFDFGPEQGEDGDPDDIIADPIEPDMSITEGADFKYECIGFCVSNDRIFALENEEAIEKAADMEFECLAMEITKDLTIHCTMYQRQNRLCDSVAISEMHRMYLKSFCEESSRFTYSVVVGQMKNEKEKRSAIGCTSSSSLFEYDNIKCLRL